MQFSNGRGFSSYEAQRSDELPFNKNSEKLFSETLPNKLAFSKISVYISAIKLIPSNNGNNLFLRLVYKVIYTHFATTDGININGYLTTEV
ncbi:hypothetical protein [Spiroplasma endosymbiont of Polydrusus formosus]|uniref:hypothetical protein n=1 Tax=Spiroplasma endosymbiont of Polydrusus formosus TaxID=3139326 RepID=UPI0035B53002